ncbi:putative RNA methyltransferase CT0009 [Phytophthora ramorum]|uniref:putative RNA methyltransferase CT0009 n=1 Tax=Phytophthora ramorum TaxID=164328 RepID=UPI0030A3FA26|nr:putative RNA methyltransferase CT0009 [Phytophthora ramorum]
MVGFLVLCSRISASSTQYQPKRWTPVIDRLFSSGVSPPAPNTKRLVALAVDKLNGHGDGIGSYVSPEGTQMQVVVPFAASGDELQVEIWEKDVQVRDKWAADPSRDTWPLFGQQVELSRPSDHRVQPLCKKYFASCGGCKLQHLSYGQQLKEKQEWVRGLFEARRHSPDMEIREILGVEAQEEGTGVYHYRNKMEFTCSTGRWLLDEDKPADDGSGQMVPPRYPFTVGMFPVASVSARRSKQVHGKSKARRRRAAVWSPRILSLSECLLQASACNRLLQQLVTRCEDEGLQAYDFNTHEGFLKQIVLRRGANGEGRTEIMLGLVTTTFDGEQSELLKRIVSDLVEEHEQGLLAEASDAPRLVSIVESLDSEAQRHRRRKNDEASESAEVTTIQRVLYGNPHLQDTIMNHRFEISFDSFFQPNSSQASVLYREIQRMMAALPEKPVVWDLFCGVGSIGICMGEYAKKVVGFELVEAAVERAKVNARLNGYSSDHMQFFCVDLTKNWQEDELLQKIVSSLDESALTSDLPDMVIVDPPRAGLHKKLIKMLRRMAPKHICYVSCNPHSQVVDLEALCAEAKPDVGEFGTYRVRHLQPVDMLPHTPHIETIAWLERCN